MRCWIENIIGMVLAGLTAFTSLTAHAQMPLATSFTYQGELASGGVPATGEFDVRFSLYDAAAGGTQIGSTLCSDNLSVSNGRFTVSLDFGVAFNGQKRFLEIEVRQDGGLDCSDATGYTVLVSRQELTAAPHSAFALTAGNATNLNGQPASFFSNAANLTGTLSSMQLSGTYTGPLTLNNPLNVFTGNGASITNLSATNIASGTLDAARMPTNWAAGGDLGGFFPDPAISVAVTLSKLAPSVQGVLSQLSSLTPGPIPLDAVAWGLDNRNQSDVPALPPGVTYTAAAGGSDHSLALRSDGTVVAWGNNDDRQLNVPALPPGVTYTAVAAGGFHSLALRSDGTLAAWGYGFSGESNVPELPSGVTYVAVAAGFFHSVALRSDGTVVAWGADYFGQLDVPALPPGVTYTSVAAGYYHNLALRSDGTVAAWGYSTSGQLDVPALPPGVTYTAVAAGDTHSLALRSDGTVAAWGHDDSGLLDVPALPPGVIYTAIAGGGYHSLALRSDGTVVAWGWANYGQTSVPASPPGVKYAAVAAGGFHSLALRSSIFAPSLSSAVGLSVGSATPPPASGGISVAGDSLFAAGVSAASFSGSGTGLTNLPAANITGILASAQIPSLDASKISTGTLASAQIPNLDASKISTGTLSNAQTTGTSLSTPSTLVLRDASRNFSAGTITANLNGNATTATNAGQLNGQPASFYTNAASITSGTLADARLASNIPRLNNDNAFTSIRNSFAGRVGINTSPGVLELDVNGRVNVAQGVIQKDLSAGVVTSTNDLGLYSQISGGWIRFVTNNAQFAWFADSGGGTTARMTLSPAGNLNVTGSLAKAGGSFKIDHPLDPRNKFLYHSFVESPDMMNIYNGEVTTDATGYAVITLPDYFEALNRDFRYQLTVIDDDDQTDAVAWAKVVRRIGVDGTNQFAIRTFKGNVAVSWQVTGIRHDAWAQKNRIPNSVDKAGAEKGTLLHPEAFETAADRQTATK